MCEVKNRMVWIRLHRSELLVVQMNTSLQSIVFMSQCMVVSEPDQRPQFQLNRPRLFSGEAILNDRCILSVHHEQRLLDPDSIYRERKYRKRIEPESFQIRVALWVDSAGILICGQVISNAVDDDRLFHLREEDDPAGWRPRRCRKQRVIAARVQSDNRRAGKSTDAVGLQPFTCGPGVEVVKKFRGIGDHDFSSSMSGANSRELSSALCAVVN